MLSWSRELDGPSCAHGARNAAPLLANAQISAPRHGAFRRASETRSPVAAIASCESAAYIQLSNLMLAMIAIAIREILATTNPANQQRHPSSD
jgi:hypothetical protein